jgi:DNA repair protein RecN (Recombination protein N)
VIAADGRSRAFINGNAVRMQQLKSLGELLLDIHGQHFHQSLGRRPVQRDLLDHFGELTEQRNEATALYEKWQSLRQQLDDLLAADADLASRLDLLEFQLHELDALDIGEGELADLQSERQKLRNSGKLADGVAAALSALNQDDAASANSLVADAARKVDALLEFDSDLESTRELLESASIQIDEAVDSLQRYTETIDMDPARRDFVEERLDALQTMSRKHRVDTEELPALTARLRGEFDDLNHAEERGRELESQVETAQAAFLKHAESLSKARKKAATTFSAAVTEAMGGLGMPGGKFEIHIDRLAQDDARPWGIDDVEFLISANPGQPPMPLSKVASGGELSRMSLAIQVIASDGSAIPTMVFEEVDSGVGGSVAEMVGRRLQELGGKRQVLCVTHLPQVASLASQHFRISKVTDGKATRTGVAALGKEERIEELARMLGGVEITQKTLDHAAEMLAGAGRKRA